MQLGKLTAGLAEIISMVDFYVKNQTSLKKILLVEDDRFFGAMMVRKFSREHDIEVVWAMTLAQSREILVSGKHDFFVAVLDFNLPDAPNGEVIAEVLSKGIPAIVFTASSDIVVREKVWSHNVVDYIFKDDSQSLDYLLYTIRRLERNMDCKVLVVDDSSFFRKIITNLLTVHQFQVFSAHDGEEALALFDDNPDIKLVLTDYEMPKLNGIELTRKLRHRFRRDELAIIGVSAAGDKLMAASFIKNGASDFIVKQTFLTEEFYCRVTQNVEQIENAQIVLEMATKDYLTGLYNRRHFFEMGGRYLARDRRQEGGIVCAMLDIDFFKKVNDTYGHTVGDDILREVSAVFVRLVRNCDIVARYGGEEFVIILPTVSKEKGFDVLQKICK
ncbi:diguanylate cyclase, partial [bacterium]|nr:diguanylate cyclase [bacterium]